ncbi:acyl-CoA thioesterase [Planctomicrobium sp. SH527]|uniref:acyl-CoA thioesterase n=1 Tax=Planctomicrobium sp. SH527 TaxID=3448123 RepID=UPI003F5B9371
MNFRYRTFETSFTVFPHMTNYMYPMIFGGEMLSQMDIAAAMCVRRALYDSPTGCDSAVTVHCSDINFLVGAQVGDLILLKANISDVGTKSISVHVEGFRDQAIEPVKLCDGRFIFVSQKQGEPHPHGLTLTE